MQPEKEKKEDEEDEYCSECKKRIAKYHHVTRVPYCSRKCRTDHYTPRTSQAVGPVDILPPLLPHDDDFLRGEHTIPHVVAFDMQSLIRNATEPLHVAYTDENMQLAVEVVPPGGVVAREIHPTQTQFIRVVRGHARVDIFYPENVQVIYRSYMLNASSGGDEEETETNEAPLSLDTIIIHAGVYHKVTNLSTTDAMKFYTVYSPHVH